MNLRPSGYERDFTQPADGRHPSCFQSSRVVSSSAKSTEVDAGIRKSLLEVARRTLTKSCPNSDLRLGKARMSLCTAMQTVSSRRNLSRSRAPTAARLGNVRCSDRYSVVCRKAAERALQRKERPRREDAVRPLTGTLIPQSGLSHGVRFFGEIPSS